MRHHKKGRTLGREAGGRRALIRSLSRALIDKEKITTTEAKAKELRPFVERLVSHGKKNTLASRRLLLSRIGGKSEKEVGKIITVISPRYKERSGGYTRIVKLPRRLKDGSSMAMIEFV